jgi:two-component system, OmpR family, sensor histidine kinase PrrB
VTRGGLRGHVALAASLATAVVIILGGGLVTLLVGVTEHRSLDRRLAEQASVFQSPVLRAVQNNSPNISVDVAASRPDVGTVLRVYRDGLLVGAVGSNDITFPVPVTGGFNTVPAGGRSWRVLARFIPADAAIVQATANRQPVVLEAAIPTSATDQLVDSLRRKVLEIAALSAVIAGCLGWYFGSVATRPLIRLRAIAEEVANSRDLGVRVPATSGPREVDDLATSFNVMLQRLQEAAAATEATLESSRAFAGNAAHEMRTPLTSMQANLDVLTANPDLPTQQSGEIVSSVAQEHRRLVSLVDALHVLARGEVLAESQKEPVDVSDVVALAVEAIGKRFPDVEYRYVMPAASIEVTAWRDGLSVLVDNLLTNAGRHGGHKVDVTLDSDGAMVLLIVDDDGPGVDPQDRQLVFERFGRGRSVKAPGTGLGLALVAQQARIHGGSVEVEDSPAGGARFKVKLQVRR